MNGWLTLRIHEIQCECGDAGMTAFIEVCPSCATPRCENCGLEHLRHKCGTKPVAAPPGRTIPPKELPQTIRVEHTPCRGSREPEEPQDQSADDRAEHSPSPSTP